RTQAEQIPDRVALRFEDETVTYGAYNDAVNRLAAALARAGAGRGTPVAILALNSPLFLAAVGAVAKLGAVGALVSTHVPDAGLPYVLQGSRAGIGLCDAHAVPALASVAGAHPVRFLADVPTDVTLPLDVRPLADAVPAAEAPEPSIPDVRGGD